MEQLPDDLENETEKVSSPRVLFPPRRRFSDCEGYKPDGGLVSAIKVALLLRKPLLLTGRPGTGKTELGHYLGWKMQLKVYQFDCKSTSVARDLFYMYNAIGHYREGGDALPFLTFNGLGYAILNGASPTEKLRKRLGNLVPEQPVQSLVIIDEIDKTPRDFPNDILNEIDNNYFRIPELGNLKVEAEPKTAPVVVITSNSEKNLPSAFLRRCVYYSVPQPKDAELRKIVSRRVDEFADENGALLTDMIRLFSQVASDQSNLRHPPGTSELLDWALSLVRLGANLEADFSRQKGVLNETMGGLIKDDEDLPSARRMFGIEAG